VVPYHNPIPDREKSDNSGGSRVPPQRQGPVAGGPAIFGAWVQAEKVMQIVLLLPSAAFIGWLGGYFLDRWLHQSWIAMAGIVFGIFAGLVGAVRMAIAYGAASATSDQDKDSSDRRNRNP
jgi:ATP synthase protein I